jgi:hypothetical protein
MLTSSISTHQHDNFNELSLHCLKKPSCQTPADQPTCNLGDYVTQHPPMHDPWQTCYDQCWQVGFCSFFILGGKLFFLAHPGYQIMKI